MYHKRHGLRFKCTGCGHCCYGEPGAYVAVSHKDIRQIPAQLNISATWFRRHYLVRLRSSLAQAEDKKFGLRLLKDGRCILLDKRQQCKAYTARPSQCRTYPFWPENLNNKAAWQQQAIRCEGIGRGNVIPVNYIESQLKICMKDQ